MSLSQRENNILKNTIEDYISLGIPVSSKKLHSGYFNHLSTATIRNSLASLEHRGMLKSIYRSSGKVPTCLLYTSPSPRDGLLSRMPSSA